MELFEVNNVDILLLQETWVRKWDASVIEQFKELDCEMFTEREPRKIILVAEGPLFSGNTYN